MASAEATAHLGEIACVRGNVVQAYRSKSAVFLDLDVEGVGFFGTALDPAVPLDNWNGRCIELYGKIQLYLERPYIVFQPDEVKTC